MPMKIENRLRADITRIARAAQRVFAIDDILAAGRAVDGKREEEARAKLRRAIEEASRDLEQARR